MSWIWNDYRYAVYLLDGDGQTVDLFYGFGGYNLNASV